MRAVRVPAVAAQRAVIGGGGIVVEGRDIGTVVWPQADVRVVPRPVRRPGRAGAPGPAAIAAEVAEVAVDIARRDAFDSRGPRARCAQPVAP